MRWQWITRAAAGLAVALLCASGAALFAQSTPGITELRDQLRARYDIVALQDGIGLVPRQRLGGIRMIEIRAGAVAVDGVPLTGGELRQKVGADADVILKVTYLDAVAQRELAAVAGASPAPAAPVPAPSAGRDVRDDDRRDSPGAEPSRGTQVRRGDLVRVGGSVTVAADEVVEGDVVAVGGSATVEGRVEGDVTVVGGSLNLGSNAVIDGDVNVVGGALNRAAGARIDGSINDVAVGMGNINPGMIFGSFWRRVGSLAGTLLRVTLLILVGWVVVAIGGPSLERIASRSGADPVRSGLAGLLAELLFIPLLIITIVVLAVSIIGIPLLVLVPFGVVLFLLLLVVGFTAVAYQVGRGVMGRLGWTERGAYAAMALGVLVVTALTIAARLAGLAGGFFFGGPASALGYLVEYVAWTVGLGATLLAWYGSRSAARAIVPPPSPPPIPEGT